MHVVTFYSYKGGVGRSMALVNIALALAEAKKRVLVVDFDLEAPGITTFSQFSPALGKPGILDYVSDFVATDVAPDIQDYIVECVTGNSKVWVLPAGDFTSESYDSRLNAIDWDSVYREHSGFLMIEDLKQQWRQFDGKGFDYVFVDSRTGHTDVGGICTRQIPDAVVLMFLPTEQNISGLEPIVKAIRDRPYKSQKPITLHFCPSNVPDLDDDEDILSTMLNAASQRLGYKKTAGRIHHYSSLELLQQTVFTTERPGTKLAKEFNALKNEIVALNYEDRDGAMEALRRLSSELSSAVEEGDARTVRRLYGAVAEIRDQHLADPEIGWMLAQAFVSFRSREDEIAALTVAVDGGYKIDQARLQRAAAHMALNDHESAIADLREIICSSRASAFEIVPAVEMLRPVDPSWLEVVRRGRSVRRLEPVGAYLLNRILMMERPGLSVVIDLCEKQLGTLSVDDDWYETIHGQLVLALIGSGRFEEGQSKIGDRDTVLESESLVAIYNYGIAEWAKTGELPVEFMKRALSFRSEEFEEEINYNQCMALASSVVQNRELALEYVSKASREIKRRGRDFSTLRYLEVSHDDLAEDMAKMQECISRNVVPVPTFFDEVTSLFA